MDSSIIINENSILYLSYIVRSYLNFNYLIKNKKSKQINYEIVKVRRDIYGSLEGTYNNTMSVDSNQLRLKSVSMTDLLIVLT